MKLLPRFTVLEWLTTLGLVAILGSLLLPDSATTTRWHLERRAREFVPASAANLTDESIIATDAQIAGTWVCRHRLDGSSFTFSPLPDGRFDADFSTSGCLGGCDLQRTALIDAGVIRLDAAVAEYLPRTYNALYVIRIKGVEYLLPSEWLSDFERELNSGSDGWEWYLFRRDNDANEQADARERRSRPAKIGESLVAAP